MHDIAVRQEILDRVVARRGSVHLFDRISAAQACLVVIDMQATFVAPGSPAEVPESRSIVSNINWLAAQMRDHQGLVCWVTHANVSTPGGNDWAGFFDHFVAAEIRERTIASLAPDQHGQQIWPELMVLAGDIHLVKNRYSALIPGSSSLERVLRSRGISHLLIAGTKTNVCCESTARDAMMMDFKVVMVSDCLAALSDEEHRASLETVIQQFGDVLTSREVAARLC